MMLPTLAQAALQRDTVVTIASRDVVDLAFGLAAASIAATFLALLLGIVVLLVKLQKASRAMRTAKQKLVSDPAVGSVRQVAANVEAISEVLKGEVSRLSGKVAHLSERLDQVSDRMEERIEEFNALMEVVQHEAEGTFVDGAATARGVRAGLGNLGMGRRARRDGRRTTGAGPNRAEATVPGEGEPVTREALPTTGTADPTDEAFVETAPEKARPEPRASEPAGDETARTPRPPEDRTSA